MRLVIFSAANNEFFFKVWKTLETAEKTLMDIQKMPEVKLTELYAPTETPRRNSCREPELAQQKRKQDLCEMEDYYLQVRFEFSCFFKN